MKDGQQLEHFRDLLKLVMLFEATQIALDKVKENPKVYRQSLKNKVNAAEKELDKTLRDALSDLYNTDEELYTAVREGIDYYTEEMSSKTIEWLHSKYLESTQTS